MPKKNVVPKADFGDVEVDTKTTCCRNCRWFLDGYPHSDGCPCMVNPPTAVVMKDLEGKDIVRTVRPIPKYPDRDFCSKFEPREQ